MSKKTILLADNSYTIRRIVELSFSEVEGIELISFENSLNLKEQLLELKPAVVLVDIKFPELNGYEVCKFINEEKTLKTTKVFLLKGGFEPVDENLLKGLSYVDIITKPFDSNALVASIEKLMKDPSSVEAGEGPSSIPEELPEVKTGPGGEDISFGDIKDEIDSDEIKIDQTAKEPETYPGEEVMPSEEITQGTQTEKQDSLSPAETPNSEDLDNPFKDDPGEVPEDKEDLEKEEFNIKMNIHQQERELDLNSLTSDEIEIKKQIGISKELSEEEGEEPEEVQGSNLDEPPKEKEDIDLPEVNGFGLDEVKEIPEEKVEGIDDVPDLDTSEIEKEIGLENEGKEEPPSSDIEEPAEDKPTLPEEQLVTYFDEEKEGESKDSPVKEESKETLELMDESPAEKELSLDEIGGEPVEEPPVVEEQVEADLELAAEEPPTETPLSLEEIGGEPEADAPLEEAKVEEDLKLEMDEPPAVKEDATEEEAAPADDIEMVAEETTAEELKPEIDEFKEKIAETNEPLSKEELQDKIEDKLSKTIEELLWEIVPPLAEKIIKEEIEKIKVEVTKTFDQE